MNSPKTIYLITRIHGLKQHLIKPEQLLRMLKSKNVAEITDALRKTDYSAEINSVPPEELDAVRLEQIFERVLSHRIYFTLQMASGSTRDLLEEYTRKIEVEDLKRISRAIHGEKKVTESQLIPTPRKYQSVNLKALIQTHNIHEMVELLRETNYKSLKQVLDIYDKYKNPLIIEAQLENTVSTSLWRKLGKAPDKRKLKDFFGTEIDLKNLLYLLSLKYEGVDQEIIERIVISVSYKLPKTFAQTLSNVPFQSVPEKITWQPYAEISKRAVDLAKKGMLTEMENIFSRYMYAYAEKTSLRNPNNIVYVFAYLELCFKETRNLVTLSLGKHLKLSQERIESLLFF